MKIPKPGKVKLPKPGKMKLRVPQINNAFLKKNLITLIAIAALLIGSGTAYGTLSTRTADHGYDPVDGVNQDRYQVLVSGKGYKLSKQQEKNYKLQKKQNKVNAAQAAQNAMNPTTIRTASGIRTFRTSSYRFHYKRNATTVSGIPSIRSDFLIKSRSKTNWTAGDEISFKVGALKYPYTTKKYIPEDDLKLSNFGGTLTYTGSEDGFKLYTWKLGEGTNKIIITATDKKNKKTATWQGQIIAGKGSSQTQQTTKPSSTKPSKTKPGKTNNKTSSTTTTTKKKEKEETVTFDFGYGTFTSGKVVIKEGTTALDILKNTKGIAVDGDEVISVKGDMSSFSLDDYDQDDLKKIFRKEKEKDAREELEKQIREELGDEAAEMTDEEIDGLVDDAFDDYFSAYTDDHFADWKSSIEEKVKSKGKIGDGFPFDEFKWTYTNIPIKKASDAQNIDLRLILDMD